MCSATRSENIGAGAPVSFVRSVAPILVANCQACHGPKTAESNYRLDTFQALMQPGDFGTAPVTPGDAEDSEIHRLITADDPHERMPNNGGRLADSEIQIIENWIREGAKFDGQDAAAPLREQIPRDIPYPPAPDVYPSALPVTAIAFTSSGDRLVVGGYHELLIWDVTAGTLAARVANIPQRTFGVAFSPDNSWLAVAGGAPGVSGEIRMIPWNGGPRPDAAPKVLATHDDVFFDVAFPPDGHQLAAAGSDGLLRVFDVATGAERLKINSHADWVTDICYSPDGKYIATASRDKTAKVFDADSGSLLTTHSEHNGPVRAIAFAPDSKSAASASGSRIRVWNVENSKLVGEIGGFEHDVNAVLAGGESILAGSADRTARMFKLADRSLVRSFTPHPAWILSLAMHEPTHRLSAGCLDGTIAVWDMESGTLVKQFLAYPSAPPE
jgi:dipeptidyl aminopeptidase/acylaminoacyl peptidase/mono/diheme cytochrome c family protein